MNFFVFSFLIIMHFLQSEQDLLSRLNCQETYRFFHFIQLCIEQWLADMKQDQITLDMQGTEGLATSL